VLIVINVGAKYLVIIVILFSGLDEVEIWGDHGLGRSFNLFLSWFRSLHIGMRCCILTVYFIAEAFGIPWDVA